MDLSSSPLWRRLSRRSLQLIKKHRNKRRASRSRAIWAEPLEDRRLMAVDWRNPVNALDVNADGFTVPIDVLQIVNELNANGSRRLADVRDPTKPFWDTTGDQFIAPLDALLVINALNNGNASPFRLIEGATLNSEATVSVTLGQASGQRVYRLQIDAVFDRSDTTAIIEDTLAVYVVDPADPSQTLLDRGQPGTAIFTLSGGRAEFARGLVRWDGSVLEIDVTELASRDTGVLKLQLLSMDSDPGSVVTLRPLANTVDLDAQSAPRFSGASPAIAAGGAVDVTGLAPTDSIKAEIQNVRFDAESGRFAADVRLNNDGNVGVGSRLAVAFPGLPSGVTLHEASGTIQDGTPFLNWQPALPNGGLQPGTRSSHLLVEFDNPQRAKFLIQPRVLAAPNAAPAFPQLGPLTAMPGETLTVPLNASDPDGDDVTFAFVGFPNLPTSELTGDGKLVFRPRPDEVGSYQFTLLATDGALETRQDVTLNIVTDPVTTTRVSGFVLDIDQTPLAGMKVEVGAVQGLTQADGSFTLDLGSGPVVGDTIKIRGEAFLGPVDYPFIAEKLAFVLEHEVFQGVNNVIDRPIYLPPLDVAGGTTIDSQQDTTVTQEIAPGEMAQVFVAAGTLMNQQGTPFTGTLSLTEVPPNLTPAALPKNLSPDLVVTIQPGEMVFATPAPLTLPNRAGWAPGTLMNLWSINPVTGEFDDVGDAKVSSDGSAVETISGGIRNSSWHFTVPQPTTPSKKNDEECECDCPPCEGQESTRDRPSKGPPDVGIPGLPKAKPPPAGHGQKETEVGTSDGSLSIMRPQVPYQAQGQNRSVNLRYNSQSANPRPIVRVGYAGIGTFGDDARIVATLNMSRGNVTTGLAIAPDLESGYAPAHYFRVGNSGSPDIALQASMATQPTGIYEYEFTSGVQTFDGRRFTGTSTTTTGQTIVVNNQLSPFGAGWDMVGLQKIVENPDGSALLVNGNGAKSVFGRGSVGSASLAAAESGYRSQPGDFSKLEKLPDGTFVRTMIDKTIYRFDTAGRIVSMTDSNHQSMQYAYNAKGNLAKLTDSVGLETTFEYAGDRVSRILDPAGRATLLEYDSNGNLIRIEDPDGATSEYQYDANHQIIAQVDERQETERYIYGSDGRIREAIRPDGTSKLFDPLETHGLFPPELTRRPDTAPEASPANDFSLVTAGQGATRLRQLNPFGQAAGTTDRFGTITYHRDEDGLVTSMVNGRGQATIYTYNDRGSVTSIRQELPGTGSIIGAIGAPGEVDEYTFQGTTGQILFYDALDESDDSLGIELVPPSHAADAPFKFATAGRADLDAGLIVLTESGQYRLRFGNGTGDYQFRVIDMTDAPLIQAGDNKSGTIGTESDQEAIIFAISGVAGQRLKIEELANSHPELLWKFGAASQVGFFAQSQSLPAEFVLPFTGTYYLLVEKGTFAPEGELNYHFRLVDTTPSTPVARSGYGVFPGEIAAGETESYTFTSPGGRTIYLASQTKSVFPSLAYRIRTPGDKTISGLINDAYSNPRVLQLTEPGTYTLDVFGQNATHTGDYQLEVRDVADSAQPITPNSPFNIHIEPGEVQVFSFNGVAFDRQMVRDLSTFDAFISQIHLDPYGLPQIGPVNTTSGTHYLLLKIAHTDTTIDGSKILYTQGGASPLTVGQTINGTLDPRQEAALYRFDADAGARLYVGDPPDSFTGIKRELFLPNSDTFVLGRGRPADHFLELPVSGEYVLAVYNLFDRPPDTEPFTLSLTNPPLDNAGAIPLNNSVSGEITTPGETRRYQSLLSAGSYFLWSSADGPSVRLFDTDRQIDFPRLVTFTIPDSNVQLDIGGTDTIGDYDLHLQRIGDAELLTTDANDEVTMPGGTSARFLRVSATAGQRFSLHAAELTGARTAQWTVFAPAGTALLTQPLESDLTFVAAQSGEFLIVAFDQDGSPENTFEPQLTDLTGDPIDRTETGELLTGQIAGSAKETFTFDLLAGDVIELDILTNGPFSYQWRAPDDSLLFDGASEFEPLSIPQTGQYKLDVENFSNDSETYNFRVQNFPVDATPIAFGERISGDLVPETQRDIYQFTGQAGQVVFLDDNTFEIGDLRLEVLTALGELLTPQNHFSLGSRFILPYTGVYYLTVATGDFFSEGNPTDYALRVLNASDSTTPVAEIGELQSGEFVATKDLRLFRVPAEKGDRLAFIPISASSLDVPVLLDLAGREIPWERSGHSFSPTFWPAADYTGDYYLAVTTFQSPPASNSFRITRPALTSQPITSAGSVTRTYEYDPVFNQLVHVVDELGHETFYTIDPANGNTLTERRVVGSFGGSDDLVTSYTYTPSGMVSTMTDELGRVTEYTYDLLDRPITIVAAKGTAAESTVHTEYDAAGRITAVTDGNGNRTDYEFDSRNLLTRILRSDPDGDGPLTRPHLSYEYDAAGNQTKLTDELNRVTTWEYDSLGRQTSFTDALQQTSTMKYDPAGNMTEMTDPLGRKTVYQYDERYRMVSMVDSLGQTTAFEYDADDNMTATIDPLGRRTTSTYDIRNRRTSKTDSLGAVVTYVYDATNNLLSITDAAGGVLRNEYDDLNRRISSTDPAGQTTTYAYDARGNLTTRTDPLGHTMRYVYDAFDRVSTTIDPDEQHTSYTYDRASNLLSVTDPVSNTTTYTYDALHRLTTDVNQLGKTRTYVYDAANNKTSYTDRNGRQIAYTYDALNRLSSETWDDGNVFTYSYDAVGNVLRVEDTASQITMTYDGLNRLSTLDNTGTPNVPSVQLTHAYDLVSNTVMLSSSVDGVATMTNHYVYDALNRLTSVTQTGPALSPKRVDLVYNALGQTESLQRFRDLAGAQLVATTEHIYDSRHRLTSINHNNAAASTINFEELTYDAADRITKIVNGDGTSDYAYDDRDQLTGAEHSDTAKLDETYEYDANGNRTSSSLHGDDYVTGRNNQLLSDGTYNYGYDDEGNMVRRTEIATGSVRDFTWDFRNRLIAISDKTGDGETEIQRVEFTYDGSNRRISKTVTTSTASSSTYHVYDGAAVLFDFFDPDGPSDSAPPHLVTTYLHGSTIDQVLAQEADAGTVIWLLSDHLGSTTDLLDNSGEVIDHIKYDSFGNVVNQSTGAEPTRYLYTGRELDSETGLYYYRNRYYAPSIGRFISEDPIGVAGGINLGQYVGNSPLSVTDPYGLLPQLPAWADDYQEALADLEAFIQEDQRRVEQEFPLPNDPRGWDRNAAGNAKFGDKNPYGCIATQKRVHDLIDKWNKTNRFGIRFKAEDVVVGGDLAEPVIKLQGKWVKTQWAGTGDEHHGVGILPEGMKGPFDPRNAIIADPWMYGTKEVFFGGDDWARRSGLEGKGRLRIDDHKLPAVKYLPPPDWTYFYYHPRSGIFQWGQRTLQLMPFRW